MYTETNLKVFYFRISCDLQTAPYCTFDMLSTHFSWDTHILNLLILISNLKNADMLYR